MWTDRRDRRDQKNRKEWTWKAKGMQVAKKLKHVQPE
jgi:hypothetical protein